MVLNITNILLEGPLEPMWPSHSPCLDEHLDDQFSST